MTRSRNLRSGVSLLETLVALAVMALLALIMGSGLGAGTRVLGRSGAIAKEVDQAIARHDLRRWLELALPTRRINSEHPGLNGQSDYISFLASPDDGRFWPGMPVVVEVSAGDLGHVVAKGQGVDPRDERSEQVAELALTGAAVDLEISYFGRITSSSSQIWQNRWPASAGLPDLVKFVFTGDTAPPTLVVRPAKVFIQREMSLSSLLPPALPSRP